MNHQDSRVEGQRLMKQRRFQQAIQAFEHHLAEQGDDIATLMELGICHLLKGSQEIFLSIHEKVASRLSAAGDLPAAVDKLWQQYHALFLKVVAGSAIAVSMTTAAMGQSAHRYSGGVYVPVPPIDQPDSTPVTQPPQIDPDSAARNYQWGDWGYTVGTVGGKPGVNVLVHGNQPVRAEQDGAAWTPWGVMRFTAQRGWTPLNDPGFDPAKAKMIASPAATTNPAQGQPDKIDTAKDGTYKWDGWSYRFTITGAGADQEKRSGQLAYNNAPVADSGKDLQLVWTPWGIMGSFKTEGGKGWLPSGPKNTALDQRRGQFIPNPAAKPGPLPYSGHKYSGGVRATDPR